METQVFRWSCFGLAAVTLGILLWMLNDVRVEVKRTSVTVNEHLPVVLANVKTSTEVLATLAKDLSKLRDLAGGAAKSAPRGDASLAEYADKLLDFLETQKGQIGLDKVFGSGVKDLVPIAEWTRAARKEALWLTFRANSKAELLDRLGKNKFGAKWFYAPEKGDPVALIDFLKKNVPDA